MQDEQESFGAWLGRQLRRKGMSQAELAAALDVTRAAVSAWITGRAAPRPDKMQAIEEILGLAGGSTVTRSEAPDSAGSIEWIHRRAPEDGGRELGNAAAFAFGSKLSVLAREAAQNSLDECHDLKAPVRVRYILHELTGERTRAFLEAIRWRSLEPHLKASADPKQKVGRVLLDGLRELEETGRLLLLRIDDYNASGLTGPEYDDGRFAAVVRRQLDSFKGNNPSAGGSFGLGKAALWAASRFGIVLMHSTLSVPYEGRVLRRLVGRIDLPWREITEGEEAGQYAGPGWLGERDPQRESAARSWWADEQSVRDLHLTRESGDPGTSFLIVGLHDAEYDPGDIHAMHKSLLHSVSDNFWASMVKGSEIPARLVASVQALRDGEVLIPEERIDPHLYQPDRSRAVQAYFDGLTKRGLTDDKAVVQREVELKVPALKGVPGSEPMLHNAVLLITPSGGGEDAEANRLVTMRGTLMVVHDEKVGRLPTGARDFQAVLLAGHATRAPAAAADSAERFLRAAEPPEHDKWQVTDDLRATYARGVMNAIKNFLAEARREVREAITPTAVPAKDIEAVLDPVITPRPQPKRTPVRTGFPAIKSARGQIIDGAWNMRVEVRLPEREDPWVRKPVLKFAVRSGSPIEGRWAEIRPETGCREASGTLVFDAGARSAVFIAISDPTSHPVDAAMTVAEIDLVRAREGAS